MGIIKNLLKQIFSETTIYDKEKISESAYKISIKGESIKSAEFVPGYFLRISIGMNGNSLSRQDFMRTYSVWNIDKNNGTIDLAVATHSKGAGADWVEQLKTDDKIYFKWKKGNFLVDNNADSYLMIGDLSALSHLYMIKRNLPQDKQVVSILYSQHKDEFYTDIDGTTPFDYYEMPLNPYEEIINKIKEIVPKMNGIKMVYIGGDNRICIAVNKFFRKELHWETKQIKTKPFWNPNKKGLE